MTAYETVICSSVMNFLTALVLYDRALFWHASPALHMGRLSFLCEKNERRPITESGSGTAISSACYYLPKEL